MNNYRFADIYTGLSHSFKVTVTPVLLNMFSDMSGDKNPMHMDATFAAKYGFSDRVAYGMLTASFYSTLVGMYLPGEYALLQGLNLSFTSPVYPGDTLTVFGEVVFIHEAYRQIELKAYITGQNGQKVSRAKIRVGINE